MKNYVKVVLLGDGILHINLGRVGKTSIINKFVKNKFDETSESTLNSYYLEKEVEFENHKFTLCIWVKISLTQDTAGQEKFNALTPIYYRGAKAAVLVYDVGLSETFKKVKKWIAELREFNKEANTIVIAGNKVDLKKFDIEKESILKYLLVINKDMQKKSKLFTILLVLKQEKI